MSETDTIIRLANVSKMFPTGVRQHSLLRTLTNHFLHRESAGETFAALRTVDLEVRKGDSVGLIGNNGAGKSTLLRVVAGLHPPSSGTVEVIGSRTLLAGLGVGMVDELNVEHNIFLYGALHGIVREELKLVLEEILDWAELTGFSLQATLEEPLQRDVEPPGLLGYALLRFGDLSARRSFDRRRSGLPRKVFRSAFQRYQRQDRTMLVASHDL